MTSPLDRPAELSSPIPIQVLLALFGCFLVLLEGAFAQWQVFFVAAPLLVLAYVFYMNLFFSNQLSIIAAFLIGLFSELMFFETLGMNATALALVALITRWRSPILIHSDFLEIWSAFSLIVLFFSSFKMTIYLLAYLSLPAISDIFLQAGMTILLFPIFYVLLVSAASAGQFILRTRMDGRIK
ncbi:MAG: hypothetical protein ISQ23_03455 [Alphaproteobacteria bacterium]|nr:hypothetical protein [Alphaproteobacteria bacterium]MBL6776549.1 hypothetical protein [Alphaproteobacteria bacterium]